MKTFTFIVFVSILIGFSSIETFGESVRDILLDKPNKINVNGTYYNDGQTVYIDCNQTLISVFLQPLFFETTTSWQTSSNFSYTNSDAQTEVKVTLDPNRNDGYVKGSYIGGSDANFITVYIKQKSSIPTFTSTQTLCTSGQNGTFSAQISYGGANSVGILWEATGGVTINGGSSYTTNGTTGSVTVQLNSYGTLSVSGIISGCSNSQSYPAKIYIGTPTSSNITFTGSGGSDPGSAFCSGQTANFQSNPNLPVGQYSYAWSVPQGSSNLTYYYAFGPNATVTAGAAGGGFILQMNVTNSACNTTGVTSRTFGIRNCNGGYRVAGNPTTTTITALFDPSDDAKYLPNTLRLANEKGSTVKEIKIKGQHSSQEIKEGVKVDIDVHSLPRNTYYLQGIYESGKVESIRVVLN